MNSLSTRLDIAPVPAPHRTLIYGIPFLNDMAAIDAFLCVKRNTHEFPRLVCNGCVCDVEIAGVAGGLMSMVWAEISYKRGEEHEEPFYDVYKAFTGERGRGEFEKWIPHVS